VKARIAPAENTKAGFLIRATNAARADSSGFLPGTSSVGPAGTHGWREFPVAALMAA